MIVDVKYGLSRFRAAINDETESRQVSHLCQLVGDSKSGSGKFMVALFEMEKGGQMFFRQNEKVNRSLGINVLNNAKPSVIKNLFGGNFPFDDFTK
jgi:hypothetical protein